MRQITAVVLRLLLLPLVLLGWLARLTVRLLNRALRPLLVRVDKSPGLSNLINSLSSSMATQRGLLLMIGTGIVLLSLVLHGVIITALVATGSFDRYLYWLCLPLTFLHVGVMAGFIGIMLAVPLGQGYKSQQQ